MWKINEMWYFLVLCIVGVVGYPAGESNTNDFENCIHMTEDIQNQINSLVSKLSSYITTISTEYEDIDLRTIAFTIDKHSPNEDEKDTVIKITVNDCLEGAKQTKYIENNEENKAPTPIENSRINFGENENSYRQVDTENQNITVKGQVHQEEKEVAKSTDKLDYIKDSSNNITNNHKEKVKDVIKEMKNDEIVLKERKTFLKQTNFENTDKLDYIEDSNNNITNNHREKVKDVIKEMKDDEIILKERKTFLKQSNFENTGKLDYIEHSNNNIPNNHREKVKDVTKEMKDSEIILKESKTKTNVKDINSGEKRYSGGTVNENKEINKNDDMFVDDDNFGNDNDFDKRSGKTKQLVDSPKDDAFSADNESNYNNTSKNENNKFDSGNHTNNDSLENTKEVYLIDYKELKKTNAVDDDETNSCTEVLLLSDEEKNIFNKIEKVRGEKPFMVYQRFFNNFTQYWFF